MRGTDALRDCGAEMCCSPVSSTRLTGVCYCLLFPETTTVNMSSTENTKDAKPASKAVEKDTLVSMDVSFAALHVLSCDPFSTLHEHSMLALPYRLRFNAPLHMCDVCRELWLAAHLESPLSWCLMCAVPRSRVKEDAACCCVCLLMLTAPSCVLAISATD